MGRRWKGKDKNFLGRLSSLHIDEAAESSGFMISKVSYVTLNTEKSVTHYKLNWEVPTNAAFVIPSSERRESGSPQQH